MGTAGTVGTVNAGRAMGAVLDPVPIHTRSKRYSGYSAGSCADSAHDGMCGHAVTGAQ